MVQGGGARRWGRPTLDEWIRFVIQIADPDSARDCLCCVKCVLQTVAGGADDEIEAKCFGSYAVSRARSLRESRREEEMHPNKKKNPNNKRVSVTPPAAPD